jgi:lipopolysaccharide transport system ATP-binding protein
MNDVAKGGRTVLFVSHNMGVVQTLCKTGVLLNAGRIVQVGTVSEVLTTYVGMDTGGPEFKRSKPVQGVGIASARLQIRSGEDGPELLLHTMIQSDRTEKVSLDLRLADNLGLPVAFGSLGQLGNTSLIQLSPGENEIHTLHRVNLAKGHYSLSLDVAIPHSMYYDRLDQCIQFDIDLPPELGDYRRTEQFWGHGSIQIPSIRVNTDHAGNN